MLCVVKLKVVINYRMGDKTKFGHWHRKCPVFLFLCFFYTFCEKILDFATSKYVHVCACLNERACLNDHALVSACMQASMFSKNDRGLVICKCTKFFGFANLRGTICRKFVLFLFVSPFSEQSRNAPTTAPIYGCELWLFLIND